MADKEEEEKEEKSITKSCVKHKMMMKVSFPDVMIRHTVQLAQASLVAAFMQGKGFMNEDEMFDELRGKCINCYWEDLVYKAVHLLDMLGVDVKESDVKISEIVEPPKDIWKN